MDTKVFDTLTRSLADRRCRRGALATVVGGMLGVSLLAGDVTEAKKGKNKNRKRRKKRKAAPPIPPPPPGPPPPIVQVFDAPGSNFFTAPQAGTVQVEAQGAARGRGGNGGDAGPEGGFRYAGGPGGRGGKITARFAVTAGEVLQISVPSPARDGSNGLSSSSNGDRGAGGNGGGASTVIGGDAGLVIAGGGGGGGGGGAGNTGTGVDGGLGAPGSAAGGGSGDRGGRWGGAGKVTITFTTSRPDRSPRPARHPHRHRTEPVRPRPGHVRQSWGKSAAY